MLLCWCNFRYIFDTIKKNLYENISTNIANFGIFKRVAKGGYSKRNPKTDGIDFIARKFYTKFIMKKSFKQELQSFPVNE